MTIPNASEHVESLDHSLIPSGKVKSYGHSGNSIAVCYKIKHLTRDPAVAFLGIYHRQMKTYIHTKTCT